MPGQAEATAGGPGVSHSMVFPFGHVSAQEGQWIPSFSFQTQISHIRQDTPKGIRYTFECPKQPCWSYDWGSNQRILQLSRKVSLWKGGFAKANITGAASPQGRLFAATSLATRFPVWAATGPTPRHDFMTSARELLSARAPHLWLMC